MDQSKPLTETELILGYGRIIQPFELGRLTFTQCVCGAWLGKDTKHPETVEALIEAHVKTAMHARWRKEHLKESGDA